MRVSTPFAHRVPIDMVENLKWRSRVHQRVMEDPSFASVIRNACAVDPVFYVNGFQFTFDTRSEPFSKLPMILYPQFQTAALLEIIRCFNKEDLLIEKTRDMGASSLCAIAVEWVWHFSKQRRSFLLGSRTEDYVDKSDNPKSLFWKLDFIHEGLPSWLIPAGYNRAAHRRHMHMTNPETKSVIDGESTNKEFARGDRRFAIILDEFAAVDQGQRVLDATLRVTNSRIVNSTPLGPTGAYYDLSLTNIKKLRLFWDEHPEKRKGLYTTDEHGKLKVLDPENYPEDYKPILDGKLRSVMYDFDWNRSSPRTMAQEWDIDYGGSGDRFFSAEAVQDTIRRCARPPILVGDLEYDNITCEPLDFRHDEYGRLRLWFQLDDGGKPPMERRIVVGCDVAVGTGNSNSAACGFDSVTHEKLFEYANPFISPEEFAKQVVSICRWFGKPYLIWENNGAGLLFGRRVLTERYNNVYFRRREESISRKVSDVPGWASTKETKLMLLGKYRHSLESKECSNRSKEALEECLEYMYDPNGGVSHVREQNRIDPTGAKGNHGDRVVADALAWWVIADRKTKPEPKRPAVPVGSLAWRREMRKEDERKLGEELKQNDGW